MRRATESFRGYGVIMADPAWQGDNGANRAAPAHNVGAAGKRGANAYRTMPLREVLAMPVESIAAKDCLLGLWAPWIMAVGPEFRKGGGVLPPPAVQVALAWGFTPFHCVPWIKGRWRDEQDPSAGLVIVPGMGNYVRAASEALLLCKRGSPRVDVANRRMGVLLGEDVDDSVALLERRSSHSKKPAIGRALLEALLPDAPRAELFARQTAPGWDAWGNEAPESSERLLGALGAFWRDS